MGKKLKTLRRLKGTSFVEVIGCPGHPGRWSVSIEVRDVKGQPKAHLILSPRWAKRWARQIREIARAARTLEKK